MSMASPKDVAAPTHKIVARFADGRMIKGHTNNFSPDTSSFDVASANNYPSPKPQTVDVLSLKAIYFVKDFEGLSSRKDRSHFVPGQTYQGRKIEVLFKDGEVLFGAATTYSPEMHGFFVFPADPDSNTIKVYAVNAAIRKIVWLQ